MKNLNPCIGVCTRDAQGNCPGCKRTADELMNWRRMTDEQKAHVIDHVLPARGYAGPLEPPAELAEFLGLC